MHFVDEGRGHPVVFVHGGPTWSFLYRALIADLCRDFRCLALDHLGFGLSEKPERADYSPQAHARRLGEFIDRLGLEEVSIVAHDYGAAIALAWARENQDRLRDFVVFNAWLWSLSDDPFVRKLNQVVANPLNLLWQKALNMPPKFFLPVMFADGYKLHSTTFNQYLEPFRKVSERRGAVDFVRSLLHDGKWFDGLWADRRAFAGKRSLLIWGLDDAWQGEASLTRWADAFPLSKVVALPGITNYVPEHVPRRCAAEIRMFLSGASSRGVLAAR